MKPEETIDECKGCASFSYNTNSPYCKAEVDSRISLDQSCPCLTCLIKGVCDTICEEFEYYNNISNEERNGQQI